MELWKNSPHAAWCYSFFNSWIAILQVDENGKINRLRRECPAEKCGAGVFMAAHKDRQYCGKCGKTFVFNAPE